MLYDLNQAFTQLADLVKGPYTEEDLLNLVRQVDIAAEGNVTVLYSGEIYNNIAAEMVNDPNTRVINKTAAAEFLSSNEFLKALGQTKGISLTDMRNSSFTSPEKTALFEWFFNGKNGPWAETSKRFIQATVGSVRIMTTSPNKAGALHETEIPTLLDELRDKTAITDVDGFTREQILKIGNTYTNPDSWRDALRNTIVDNAITQTNFSNPVVGNYGDYIELTGSQLNDLVAKASPTELNMWHQYLKNFEVPKAATKALNKLGTIGALLAFGLASSEAGAAELNGDHEGAKEIMALWAVDASGSSIAEVASGAIAGIGATALVAGGVITAPVAGAMVLGAALVGGIFGGDGATGLYELFKDKDENGRRDIIDKLGNLLFGEDFSITAALPGDLNGDRLTLDTTLSREDIVSNAKTDIAWRYALRELNPFVVPDISYDRHNTDGSLDLYDPVTGQGAMTELYLQDRAAMLAWKIRYDRGLQASDTRTIQGDWDFVDYSIQAGGAPLTLAIEGNGISIFDHQIVFGSKHADTLEGSGDSDHLFGSGGDDILTGRGGNDYLEGGLGNDTYIFYSDDGFDTLLDTDGLGKIQWDGLEIKGSNTGGLDPSQWQQLNNTFWQDQANHIVYTLKAQADGSKTLFINKAGGQLRVDHWVDGNLGITLGTVNVVSTAIHIYNGDQRAPLIGSEIDLTVLSSNSSFNTFKWSATSWAADGTLTGGIVQADFNDVIVGSSEADSINGLGGNDALDGRAGNDVLDGGAGDDLIAGGAGSDVIYGGAGSDMILSATGLNVAQRTGPSDTWQTPYGKTVWIKGSNWGVADAGGLYNYTISGGASVTPDNAPDIIFSGAGDDRVIGGLGDDYMDGGLGNDLLVGHGGSDILDGGDGDDLIQGDGKVSPGYYESVAGANHGNDYLDGGAGGDTLLGGGKNDVLFGGSGNDRLWGDETYLPGQFHGNDYLDGGDGDDQLVGGGMDDTLIGGGGKDTLYGDDVFTNLAGIFHGNDTLDGGVGNDTLFGGGKDDTLFGGTGNDFLWGDEESESYLPGQYHGKDHLDGGEGNDKLVGGGDDDMLIGGVGNDTLFGDDSLTKLAAYYHGNDYLDGGEGNDQLVGGGGNDILLGGAGIDLLLGEDGNDTLEGGDGDDLSSAYGNMAGNGGLSGGAGDDKIYGGAGRDELNGGDGLDLLDGGTGDDLLFGGTGDDTLYGGGGNDELYGENGNDILEGGEGADYLFGQSGNDTLIGGAGADYLSGGSGNDTYVIDNVMDYVDEALNQGTETIQSNITYTLGANIENLTLTGTIAINGTGNALNNILTGNSAANTLTGDAGDDTYVIGKDDLVVEAFGKGTDTVQSSITYTLTDNVENLTLTGTEAIAGSGNSLNNVLVGNSAANTLSGGAGADSLNGGNGDDTYVVDSTLDRVTEAPNEGTDTVQSSVTLVLGANVENLILTGTVAINGTGNLLNNTLTGNSGVNTLSGGLGDDTYVIGINDLVVEASGEGNDTVQSSITYTLTNNVENLILTGTAAINGTGNDLNNSLTGNAAGNVLYGGLGTDLMQGGAGDDTYVFNRGDGIDTILDSGVQDANLIQFGRGILPVDIVYDWEGSTLILNYGPGDAVRIPDFDCAGINGSPVVLTMAFEDGAVISLAEFLNRAPVAGEAISAPEAVEDLDYQFTVPVDAFTDPDSGDLLSYVANLADGRSLPSWLVFNSFTQTFSGTPGNEQVGGLDIALEARDMHGLSAAQTFRLEVRNVNDAPVAMAPISPRTLLEDEPFFYTLPDAMFVDEDAGDSLTYSAMLADSSPLPSWLSFEGATRTFSGTPGNADVGDVAIWVAATDQAGASATSVFNLTIQNVNDAPFVSTPIADRNTKQGQAFQYTLPTNTFADRDMGDRLSYAATLEDGKPLPAWLTFDNATLTFASTRGIPDAGNFNIRVTATDQADAQVSDSFTLNVSRGYNEINGAPGKLILNGSSANDRIDAKGWISIMTGRGGDDLYIIDNQVEFVLEWAGEGVDTVEASVNYQLPQFVENLILTGSKAINGAGNGLDNLLVGNSAANTLSGLMGNDSLNGGDGNDYLYGDNGNDILDGGLGKDYLSGGAGNDTYLFGRSSGADVVRDVDTTAGNTDVLFIGSGVAPDQLWFRRTGSDLAVGIIGTTDKNTISNWYSGRANHIEQFKTANGKMLLDSQVDALVSAMAAFAPPAAGQTTLPPDYQAALAPVIAANWK